MEKGLVHLKPVKIIPKNNSTGSDLIIPGRVIGGNAVGYDDDRMHVSHPIRFYRVIADADKKLDGKLVMAYQSRVLTAQSSIKTVHMATRDAIIAVCTLDPKTEIETDIKIF